MRRFHSAKRWVPNQNLAGADELLGRVRSSLHARPEEFGAEQLSIQRKCARPRGEPPVELECPRVGEPALRTSQAESLVDERAAQSDPGLPQSALGSRGPTRRELTRHRQIVGLPKVHDRSKRRIQAGRHGARVEQHAHPTGGRAGPGFRQCGDDRVVLRRIVDHDTDCRRLREPGEIARVDDGLCQKSLARNLAIGARGARDEFRLPRVSVREALADRLPLGGRSHDHGTPIERPESRRSFQKRQLVAVDRGHFGDGRKYRCSSFVQRLEDWDRLEPLLELPDFFRARSAPEPFTIPTELSGKSQQADHQRRVVGAPGEPQIRSRSGVSPQCGDELVAQAELLASRATVLRIQDLVPFRIRNGRRIIDDGDHRERLASALHLAQKSARMKLHSSVGKRGADRHEAAPEWEVRHRTVRRESLGAPCLGHRCGHGRATLFLRNAWEASLVGDGLDRRADGESGRAGLVTAELDHGSTVRRRAFRARTADRAGLASVCRELRQAGAPPVGRRKYVGAEQRRVALEKGAFGLREPEPRRHDAETEDGSTQDRIDRASLRFGEVSETLGNLVGQTDGHLCRRVHRLHHAVIAFDRVISHSRQDVARPGQSRLEREWNVLGFQRDALE